MYIVENKFREYRAFDTLSELRSFIRHYRLTVERYRRRSDCTLVEVSESFMTRCPWEGVR